MTLYDELFSYSALEQILSDESRVKGMLQFEAALAIGRGAHRGDSRRVRAQDSPNSAVQNNLICPQSRKRRPGGECCYPAS